MRIRPAVNNGENSPFLRGEEILAISENHILNTRLKDDRAHWALLAGAVPAPDPI